MPQPHQTPGFPKGGVTENTPPTLLTRLYYSIKRFLRGSVPRALRRRLAPDMERCKRKVRRVLRRKCPQFVFKKKSELQLVNTERPVGASEDQFPGIKIWIDLENTPHIPFFNPIIRALEKQGHRVVLTARDGYQTCEMADFYSLKFQRIGHHYGKRISAKAWGLLARSYQLLDFARREEPALAVNLGSRSQNLTAKLLGIPVVEIMDYEHTAESRFLESRWYLTPKVVCSVIYGGRSPDRVRYYEGIKEDV